jgi:hypothetical protein
MNINKLITLILILPALIISLSGCRGAGKYVDDVGKIVDNNADDAGRIVDNNADDAGRIVDNNADDAGRIVDNNADEIINIAKERLIECAKSASKSSVEQTIKTAISSGYTQVSVEYLLNVSINAIQEECVEVKLAKMTYDALSRESAESSVSSAESEYQGQIEFVLP